MANGYIGTSRFLWTFLKNFMKCCSAFGTTNLKSKQVKSTKLSVYS